MNPTSIAGSPIPSHGVRNASSMRSDLAAHGYSVRMIMRWLGLFEIDQKSLRCLLGENTLRRGVL